MSKIRKAAKAAKRKKEAVLGDEEGSGQGSEEDSKKIPPHEGPGEWNEEGHEEPLYEDAKDLQQISRLEPGHHHNHQKSPPSQDSTTNM